MKENIIFIKKNSFQTLSTDEVLNIFENEDDLDKIKEAVEKAEDRIVVTWATVDIKDKAGENVPIEDAIKQQDILLKRDGPISDEHTNKIIGKTLAYKVMTHPESNTLGILHLDKYHKDNEYDDIIWNEIQTKERKGSSVGGFNLSNHMGTDKATGERSRFLDNFRQVETASVRDPCNPLALNEAFSVVAKSNISNVQKPFAGYANFNACVLANKDKKDPQAYCATIMRAVEKADSDFKIQRVDEFDESVLDTQLNPKVERVVERFDAANKSIDSDIKDFLSSHPNPKDEEVHAWAESKKYPKDKVEEALYRIASANKKGFSDDEIKSAAEKLGFNGDMEQFKKGLDVELEHKDVTNGDIILTAKIALAHLKEDPKYYDKLAQVESKKENVINKLGSTIDNKNQGDKMADEKKEKYSELKEAAKALVNAINKMDSEGSEKDVKEDKLEEEKKAAEEKKKLDEETEKAKKVAKENAAGDIEGEKGSQKLKSPEPKDNNDKDVFKALAETNKTLSEVQKSISELRTVQTPRPGMEAVTKSQEAYSKLPLELASGKKKMDMMEVHKVHNEYYDSLEVSQ